VELVVDTNILFSFFWKESVVREIIIDPDKKFNLELFMPPHALIELELHKEGICEKAGITTEEFEFAFSNLQVSIMIVPIPFFDECKSEAEKLAPHLKDVPFFALALKLGCAIWSEEEAFKRQNKVEVFNIKELIDFLSKAK
jgi:predicted nucleic acid-binding protein